MRGKDFKEEMTVIPDKCKASVCRCTYMYQLTHVHVQYMYMYMYNVVLHVHVVQSWSQCLQCIYMCTFLETQHCRPGLVLAKTCPLTDALTIHFYHKYVRVYAQWPHTQALPSCSPFPYGDKGHELLCAGGGESPGMRCYTCTAHVH